MPDFSPVVISGAVEGLLDEAVVERLIEYVGGSLGPVYGRKGKGHLLQRLDGYNQAARFAPWIVLVDLNTDCSCAPPYQQLLLPLPAPHMCFRIAVRTVEAWLLADRERLARFLGIARDIVPSNPEAVRDPKLTVVALAKRSRRRQIVQDVVPRAGSGRTVGSAYTSCLIDFVRDPNTGWRPDVAANLSDSLNRCIRHLRRLLA